MADQLSPSRGIEVEVDRAIGILAPSADAVFLRHPAVDPSCPRTSDLDFLAFAPVKELVPERLFFDEGRPVDVIWLPSASLDEPSSFAKQGVLPHRLLTSRIVSDPAGTFEGKAALVAETTFEASIQAERIAGFLDLGFLTVREIGINWDAPEIALFYLHMAYAACLAALADAARTYAPNLYTRPFDYVPPLEAKTGLDLTSEAVPGLGLEDDVEAIAAALLRLHGVLAARFPEPAWPSTMRASTRAEYRYFLDRREIAWRIEVAREMARRGNARNGVFYLRLLAYLKRPAPVGGARRKRLLELVFHPEPHRGIARWRRRGPSGTMLSCAPSTPGE